MNREEFIQMLRSEMSFECTCDIDRDKLDEVFGNLFNAIMSIDEAYERGRIDAVNELAELIYHEAFEVDHSKDGMQKWDSGNWIRYKLIENVFAKFMKRGDERCVIT